MHDMFPKTQKECMHDNMIEDWIKDGRFAEFTDYLDFQINKHMNDTTMQQIQELDLAQLPSKAVVPYSPAKVEAGQGEQF